MSSDLLDVFLLSLVVMFNPTLLAAVTVMLLLPKPKRLMLGYLLGAYTTSIAAGVLILFSLHGSGAESTSKRTIGPQDIVVGLLVVAIAWVLRPGETDRFKSAAAGRRVRKPRPGRTRASPPSRCRCGCWARAIRG
jgi:hypothetical protein